MRHRKTARKLNRNSSHRSALLRNLSASLFAHEVIKTTLPKAKELRKVVEPLITLAKKDSVAHRRLVFARLRSKDAVAKLFSELGPRFQDRAGGYLRILKCGYRRGDAAPMAYVQLLSAEASLSPKKAHKTHVAVTDEAHKNTKAGVVEANAVQPDEMGAPSSEVIDDSNIETGDSK